MKRSGASKRLRCPIPSTIASRLFGAPSTGVPVFDQPARRSADSPGIGEPEQLTRVTEALELVNPGGFERDAGSDEEESSEEGSPAWPDTSKLSVFLIAILVLDARHRRCCPSLSAHVLVATTTKVVADGELSSPPTVRRPEQHLCGIGPRYWFETDRVVLVIGIWSVFGLDPRRAAFTRPRIGAEDQARVATE